MKSLVEEHYLEPDLINKTTAQLEAESRGNSIDLDEHSPDENDNMEDVVVEKEDNGAILIEENEDLGDMVIEKEDDGVILIDD